MPIFTMHRDAEGHQEGGKERRCEEEYTRKGRKGHEAVRQEEEGGGLHWPLGKEGDPSSSMLTAMMMVDVIFRQGGHV